MSTPSTQRANPLRMHLTPGSSPFTSKSTPIRSPTKAFRQDVALSLKQVIGTTTVSSNAIDSRPSSNSFAFTAGSAAVVATIHEDGNISQRFFRARPASTNPFAPSNLNMLANSDPRTRTAIVAREAGSPFMSPQASDSADAATIGRLYAPRDRIKAVSCVSFSRDGRLLAMGETGHKPRVLIFSTAHDAPSDIPLTSMADHTFGVRSVAFSPDGQYLASLGFVNDGFLYIWAIGKNGSATPCVRNKCTSNVRAMAWLGGCLVTVGTRHVKVWRVEESVDVSRPKPASESTVFSTGGSGKTLMGRNCVLGPLLDATFTCVVAISESKAIVCTDKGDIGILDNENDIHDLKKIGECGFPAISLAVDGNGLVHITGHGGQIVHLETSALLKGEVDDRSMDFSQSSTHGLDIAALIFLKDHMVMVDNQRSMWLQSLNDWNLASGCKIEPCKVPGLSGPVQGVSSFGNTADSRASFFTWSGDGSILAWKEDGAFSWEISVDIGPPLPEDLVVNELKVVQEIPGLGLATGDRLGIIRIVDFEGNITFEEKAHGAEITAIAVHSTSTCCFLASASRDRTLQVFTKSGPASQWSLLQTLDDHVGAVTAVLFSKTGHRLYSASADRTVVVRELATRVDQEVTHHAFLMLRTITLKATPTCIALDAVNDDALLTSTVDRYVHRHDTSTGSLLGSFKTMDSDGNDSIVLSSMISFQIPSLGATVVAGVSSTDKSVRIFTDTGFPAARDWGHTEGLSGIAVIPGAASDSCQLVTASIDGTVFMWDAGKPSSARGSDINKSSDLLAPNSEKESLVSRSPLRRVISHSEMARFQRSSHSRDDSQSSPGTNRSPVLKKRASKYALPSVPKIDFGIFSPKSQQTESTPSVRKSIKRTSSPPPPADSGSKPRIRRQTLTSRSRMKSCTDIRGAAAVPPLPNAPVPNLAPTKGADQSGYTAPPYPPQDLNAATDQMSRTLRAYRRKLMNTPENLRTDQARELEHELAITARSVGQKVNKRRELDEDMMVRLLEEHGERLVEMLGDRLQKLKTSGPSASSPANRPSHPVTPSPEPGSDEDDDDDQKRVDAAAAAHHEDGVPDGRCSARSLSTVASTTTATSGRPSSATSSDESLSYHSETVRPIDLRDEHPVVAV